MVTRSCVPNGYNIEVPRHPNTPRNLGVHRIEQNTYFYQLLLNEAEKITHFYRKGADPIIISIESSKSRDSQRILMRTAKGDIRVLVSSSTTSRALRTVIKAYPELNMEESQFLRVKQDFADWDKALLNFEAKQIAFAEKIGVVYAGEGQTTEDEILGNTNGSPAFEQFLELLGENVQLLGFTKFRGGLDVKTNTTGLRSVYATYKSIEVMFHVAPLLPYNPQDEQQVCKKRHIGNDVVIIVFKESSVPFDPQIIRSHFNRKAIQSGHSTWHD